MSANSGIEWCDATWNPTAGCSIVSPGCTNCYAMRLAHRFGAKAGSKFAGLTKAVNGNPVWNGVVHLDDAALQIPLRWRKPKRIFVNSMSDLFHESLPDDAIDRVFAVMALCPQHEFLILTKRAERMRDWVLRKRDRAPASECLVELYVRNPEILVRHPFTVEQAERIGTASWPPPNCWLGVSVEDQARADERIPLLLQTPAAVRFISAEPLLGPVDFRWPAWQPFGGNVNEFDGLRRLDWVIVGGESGHGARPFDIAWARSTIAQCRAAGVACFVKQLGSHPVGWWSNELGPRSNRQSIKNKKGSDISEWPQELRVREFPR